MTLGVDFASFAVVFAAGFVSFASPCVLPLVPAYLGFVSGVGIGEESRRRDVAIPTAAFVLGFGITFMLLGAGAGLIGGAFSEFIRSRSVEITAGVLIIVMGLLLLGKGLPMFLMRDRRIHLRNRPVTLFGAVIAGFAFALGWTPCIGPTLAAALTLAASAGNAGAGASLLFVYSLGLGVPFLLTGLFLHEATGAMSFLKRNLMTINRIGAVILIIFGVLLAIGELSELTARLSGVGFAL